MHQASTIRPWLTRLISALAISVTLLFAGHAWADAAPANAGDLFEPIRSVLQHPRCQNCHIPGDQPLQYDEGRPHGQNVMRGMDGKGMSAMKCSTCHQDKNSPAAMGEHAPPGAPHWQLPPAHNKMVFINLTPYDLCMVIKDPKKNGGRNGEAIIEHFSEDKLVAWGWQPGGNRSLPPLTKPQTVSAVKQWVNAGMPCLAK